MAKSLFVRAAAALGVTSLALFFVALIPLLSVAPTATARVKAPAFTVNRALKGDRLPYSFSAASHANPQSLRNSAARNELPIGCDPAFSPVTNPQLANYYGRCMT